MQMTFEFGLVMQRPGIKEDFDDELVLWSKAAINYCKITQKKSSAIQIVVGDTDLDCKLH